MAQVPQVADPPVLVVGEPPAAVRRVAACLDCQPDLARLPETGLAPRLAQEAWRLWRANGAQLEPHYGVSAPAFGAAYGRLYRRLLGPVAAGRGVEASPGLLPHLDTLAVMLPESPIVHVLADGRWAVAAAQAEAAGPAPEAAEAARHWRSNVTAARELGRLAGARYVEVAGEAVAADPAGALTPVLAALGSAAAPGLAAAGQAAQPAQVSLPAAAQAAVEAEAGDLLVELGYPLRGQA